MTTGRRHRRRLPSSQEDDVGTTKSRNEANDSSSRAVRGPISFLPLPFSPFEACRTQSGGVSSELLVRFDDNDYSVPMEYAHQDVVVKGYTNLVRICRFHEGYCRASEKTRRLVRSPTAGSIFSNILADLAIFLRHPFLGPKTEIGIVKIRSFPNGFYIDKLRIMREMRRHFWAM